MTIHTHSDGTADDDPNCPALPAMTEDRVPTTEQQADFERFLHPKGTEDRVSRTTAGRSLQHEIDYLLGQGETTIAIGKVEPRIYAIEAEASAQPAPPLDVERLARVLAEHFGPSYFPGMTDVTIHGKTPEAIAEQIAAEYERLARND